MPSPGEPMHPRVVCNDGRDCGRHSDSSCLVPSKITSNAFRPSLPDTTPSRCRMKKVSIVVMDNAESTLACGETNE